MDDTLRTDDLPLPFAFGRYVLTRRLGRGGMGVVYAARDERLGRDVAIKLIAGLGDASAVNRFWREARAAASVSHPHVCQIFEIDDSPQGIYLAMELLDGESLEQHLQRGPCSTQAAVERAVQLLDALQALHERGLVHRDVKPSNLFLTAHGAKLLDFGLARSFLGDTIAIDRSGPTDITQPGLIVGTPKYMAPEQVSGEALDARTDLFSAGCVLFEMLAGRPPFSGNNVIDLLFAILNEHPPALQGPDAVVAIDRVIRRALAKRSADRFQSAGEMAAALRAVDTSDTASGAAQPVRALVRLVVPPLRLQGVESDAAFLSYGLAEAMSGSLASIGGVVVRSPAVAASWPTDGGDPRKLAVDADVDLALLGSLRRSGSQLRASIQLVEAGSGTVLGAATVKGAMDDIFALEEQLTDAAAGLLAAHRGARAAPPGRADVPGNGAAFEQFLRGLEFSRSLMTSAEARACFERAVEHDPAFAPAWAWLGRTYRVLGKYAAEREENYARGERALRRALAINPDLPVAHRFLAHAESERGESEAAISRLLGHARTNRNDAHLFAGLVSSCRYSGLPDVSLAAWRESQRLDPTLVTGVEWTLIFGPPELTTAFHGTTPSSEAGARMIHLIVQGRSEEALAMYSQELLESLPIGYQSTIRAAMTVLTQPTAMAREALAPMIEFHVDPEAIAIAAMLAAVCKAWDLSLELWNRVVFAGFTPAGLLARSPLLAPLRADPAFAPILAEARTRQRIAATVFTRAGGPDLLGVTPALD